VSAERRLGGFSARLRGALLWIALWIPLLGLGPGCTGDSATIGTDAGDEAGEGYPGSGSWALFAADGTRHGGPTGGFGGALRSADFAYRLGTRTAPVAETEIAALLAARVEQIALSADHVAALSRVLRERPAFVAWQQFFADGGRVRDYRPLGPEELAKLPPARLTLAGEGRYLPDRLLILARIDEAAMEELLFHEIQHYVFDKWDSAPFEAGDADHEVIRILEERRHIVDGFRAGELPTGNFWPRLPGDADDPMAGSPRAEATASARSADFYRAWVEATVQRVRSKNESNRQVRIVSMELSNGDTLLLDERSDREQPDQISALDARVPPHYRYGPVVYVSLGDLRRFDAERLFTGGDVPRQDRSAVLEFIKAHREDWRKGRRHIFGEAEIQDMAHLSALNAAILQQALGLAERIGGDSGLGREDALKGDRFRTAFSSFLRRFVERMAGGPRGDPRSIAEGVADAVGGGRPRGE
jgi:hypothetical protein